MVFPLIPNLRFPGSLVLLKKVGYHYPTTSKSVLQDVDLVLRMGDRVGLVGLNGSGKSTSIRLTIDERKLSQGTVIT